MAAGSADDVVRGADRALAPARSRIVTWWHGARDEPRRGDLPKIAALAVLSRIIVLAAILLAYQIPLTTFVKEGDGPDYMAYARRVLGQPVHLTDFQQRLFPGFSVIMAGIHALGAPMHLAGLGLSIGATAVAAAAAAALFRSRTIGVAMAILTPHYFGHSSSIANESTMLALALCGMLLSARDRYVLAGILFGASGAVRPFIGIAVAAWLLRQFLSGQRSKALATGVIALSIVVGALLLVGALLGHPLRGVESYSRTEYWQGSVLEWPFVSLVRTSLRGDVPIVKIALVWAHVAMMLAGCYLAVRAFTKNPAGRDERFAMPWLLGQTLLVLCIGGIWGFHSFPRYIIGALPALFWAFRPLLPRTLTAWIVLSFPAFAYSIYLVRHFALRATTFP